MINKQKFIMVQAGQQWMQLNEWMDELKNSNVFFW